LGEDNIRSISNQLSKLYDGATDGIANGIAIENGETVFIVDSGKDNGKITFGIRKKKTIKDSKLRAEAVRRANNDAISKRYISDGLSSKLRGGYDNDIRRDLRRELGEELSTDTRKSANNESGVSDEVRHSRRINTEVNNERSDDFRRIQETSREMSERELQDFQGGRKLLDGALRRELSRIYGNEINASRSRRGDGNEPVVSTESFTIYKDIDASLFHDIFEIK